MKIVCIKKKYEYETLEKHFTKSKVSYIHKKLPRKFKKKLNHFIADGDKFELTRSKDYDLNVKMWYLRWFINPDYNTFLIKETCKNENSGNWLKK